MPSPRPPLGLLLAIGAVLALSLARAGEIRDRAETALGRGMPAREAALARGFALGMDEDVDERTVEDFRRSGLAHLLAVSGQNVALLALLAMPLLAALGIPLRTRLVWVLALIAVYVPLAGAGPSIQRAAVMGALNLLALLAGRRRSSFYALAVAAVVTLAIDPHIGRDPGWQLSFAAVLGILLLARPLRRALEAALRAPIPGVSRANGAPRRGRGEGVGAHLAGALADGAAMTIAATLATAPLIAFHFEGLPTATLLANLLALPAVAPAMWLGMLAAGAGQVPGFPVEALNALNAPLLAYIAQVAIWLGRPDWAYVEVSLDGRGLVVAYLALSLACIAALHLARALRPAIRRLPPPGMSHFSPPVEGKCDIRSRGGMRFVRRRGWAVVAGVVVVGMAALAWVGGDGGGAQGAPSAGTLRVSVLDVGQGDAILLQPGTAAPLLVDAGPPGAGLAGKLSAAGVDGLGAAILSHDQADHGGGLAELFGTVAVGRLFHAAAGGETLALARDAGVPATRLAAGGTLRSGGLRLEVIWPPAERLALPGEDPNALSLVLLARWRGYRLLLTGDAEAEAVPLDPGPLDALKVAHHGSEDAGLSDLLVRTRPSLALISAGADNPHGHPHPTTLRTLAAHAVPALRTDEAGTIVLDVASSEERRTSPERAEGRGRSPGGRILRASAASESARGMSSVFRGTRP